MRKTLLLACTLLLGGSLAAQEPAADTDVTERIEYIDLIHLSHTDYGFTDNPDIAHELHRKFIDIGIDAVLESADDPRRPTFCWTAEALGSVYEWWQRATPQRQKDLLRAVRSGQFDVTAAPFNIHPLPNGTQTDKLVNWVPDDLWRKLSPKVVIQDDVNGFPRALVSGLMDKGVRYCWTGINPGWGGTFHTPPYGFWWQMPDGRKILTWLSFPYWEGYLFFDKAEWRYAQRPASNTQFRTPRPDDMLKTDEASMRQAHEVCIGRLRKMIEEGYPYDFLTLSITNQYRCDNDAPFPALADFVAKWNEMGLKPRINLTTATRAMERIEKRVGKELETYAGEWPDWWVFGIASEPRALSAARQADMFLKAAQSPAWGKQPEAMKRKADAIERDICLFYEHTFGSWDSTSDTYSLWSQGHFNTTFGHAFRPFEQAKWLLAQRVRGRLTPEPEGVYVMNPGGQTYTGWARLDPYSFVRTPYKSAIDPETGRKQALTFDGGQALLWVDGLQPDQVRRFVLSTDSVAPAQGEPAPAVQTDADGWPTRIEWPGLASEPLQCQDFGELFSLNVLPGQNIHNDWQMTDSLQRRQTIAKHSVKRRASFHATECTETPHSYIYRQVFEHPSLAQGLRTIEVYKGQPHVSVEVKFYRESNPAHEIMYIRFPFASTCGAPQTSVGGMAFAPYTDQIPGTCTDFFNVDDWVKYPAAKGGAWLWSSRDAALVTFSGEQLGVKGRTLPARANELCAMVYNNLWWVNYLDDCIGDMSFRFDVQWTDQPDRTPRQLSDAVRGYLMEPVIFVNPATREEKFTLKHMNTIE